MNKQVKTTEVQKVKLDFDKLEEVLKERKMSRKELASRTGRHATYFSDLKKRDSSIPIGMEGFICSELGVEKGTFVRREQAVKRPKENSAEIRILENIYKAIQEERKILDELADQSERIWNKLNTQATQLMKIKEKVSELGISDYEKAVEFLKDALSGGQILESEVLSKSDDAGIKRADLYKAKRDAGVQSAVTGYGKNQKTWWLLSD